MASASILMTCLLAVIANVAHSGFIPPKRTVCPMPMLPPPPPPIIEPKRTVCPMPRLPPPPPPPVEEKPEICVYPMDDLKEVKPTRCVFPMPRPPPVPENVCELPKVVGMCKAYVPSYYFNSKSGKCEKFIYGGCGGNGNRFPSLAACEKKCVPDVCELPKVVGRCRAYFPSYYFNSKTGKCEKFIYGGCGGNGNRFSTLAACEKKCGTDVCELPKESGMCKAYMPSYYFNSKSGKCEEFIYGGCGGNANRFPTKAACEKKCGHGHVLVASIPQLPPVEYMEQSQSKNKVCKLPKVVGPCRAAMPRFYFDSKTGKCEKFIYGGCKGNKNNFKSLIECKIVCEEGFELKPEIMDMHAKIIDDNDVVMDRTNGKDKEDKVEVIPEKEVDPIDDDEDECDLSLMNDDKVEVVPEKEVDPVENEDKKGASKPGLCKLPKVVGPCRAAMPRFYFDSKTGKCEKFIYGGCKGNKNNFKSLIECKIVCEGFELKPEIMDIRPEIIKDDVVVEDRTNGKDKEEPFKIVNKPIKMVREPEPEIVSCSRAPQPTIVTVKREHKPELQIDPVMETRKPREHRDKNGNLYMVGTPLSISRESVMHHKSHRSPIPMPRLHPDENLIKFFELLKKAGSDIKTMPKPEDFVKFYDQIMKEGVSKVGSKSFRSVLLPIHQLHTNEDMINFLELMKKITAKINNKKHQERSFKVGNEDEMKNYEQLRNLGYKIGLNHHQKRSFKVGTPLSISRESVMHHKSHRSPIPELQVDPVMKLHEPRDMKLEIHREVDPVNGEVTLDISPEVDPVEKVALEGEDGNFNFYF